METTFECNGGVGVWLWWFRWNMEEETRMYALCIRHVMSTQTPGFPPILLCSPPKSIFFSFTWTERVLEGSGWLFEFSFTLHTGISASVEHMDIMVLDYRYIVYRRPH